MAFSLTFGPRHPGNASHAKREKKILPLGTGQHCGSLWAHLPGSLGAALFTEIPERARPRLTPYTPHDTSTGPLHRWGNGGSTQLSSFPKVRQLAGVQTQVCVIPKPSPWPGSFSRQGSPASPWKLSEGQALTSVPKQVLCLALTKQCVHSCPQSSLT